MSIGKLRWYFGFKKSVYSYLRWNKSDIVVYNRLYQLEKCAGNAYVNASLFYYTRSSLWCRAKCIK